MLNYMLLTVVVNGHNFFALATDGNATQHATQIELVVASVTVRYGDAVCVNAAVEINVLDYDVVVWRRT